MANEVLKVGDKVLINDEEKTLINKEGEIERVGGNEKWPYLVKWDLVGTTVNSAWFGFNELTLIKR